MAIEDLPEIKLQDISQTTSVAEIARINYKPAPIALKNSTIEILAYVFGRCNFREEEVILGWNGARYPEGFAIFDKISSGDILIIPRSDIVEYTPLIPK
ncbi:hypothetical protein CL616_01415 [archaeon]|nr:hypothetical protein [archaeon]|tara:strand:+ start:393 stop:689 length:297 start_codon:yes stop_codon:yes gene_type:complete